MSICRDLVHTYVDSQSGVGSAVHEHLQPSVCEDRHNPSKLSIGDFIPLPDVFVGVVAWLERSAHSQLHDVIDPDDVIGCEHIALSYHGAVALRYASGER